jgi:hypothetical protein
MTENQNRRFLDTLSAYEAAKEQEGRDRATPLPKSADELAAEAIAELTKLIDARIADNNKRQIRLGTV